ncbi:MAG: hypothetical protein COU27_01170, partial [Candidatus Levybacteria bacterium CG10_big_fil_rev_8_21_14_0_10_36_7]
MKNEIKETKELAKRIEKMAKENHLPEYLIRLVIGAEEVFVKKEEISEYLNKKTSSLSSDLRAPEKFADFCLSEAKTTNDMNYFRVLQNLCPNEKYLKEIREIWDNFILNKLEQLKPVGTGYIGMVNRLRLASRSGSEARKKATILYIESESNLTFVKSVVANLSGSQKNDAEIMAKLEIFLQRKLKEAKTNQNCALLYETAKDWQAKLSTITIIAQKWSRYINELDVFVAFNKNSYYFAVVRTKLFIKKWDKAVLIALDKTNGVLEKKILFEKTRPASRAYKKVYEAWVLSSKSELTKAKTEEELLKAIQNAPK